MGARITSTTSGAWTHANPIIDRGIKDMLETMAKTGEQMVQRRLDDVLVEPTGVYRSRINTTLEKNLAEINDGTISYGPWLEGVSSRNENTRFKGYFTFRKITQEMSQKAATILKAPVSRLVTRLNK